jgi:hypothetical protein
MLCLNKVPVHVKQEPIYTEGDHGRDEQDGELVKRHSKNIDNKHQEPYT